MMIYYYMSVEGYDSNGRKIDFLKDNLENQHLKVSRLNALNDIFEFRSHNLSNCEMRKLFEWVRKEQSRKQGIICFSRSWQNPVMWGHYGDSNRGVCLGFEAKQETLRNLSEIEYINERIALEKDDLPNRPNQPQTKINNFLNILLETKFRDWSYEQEMRLPVGLTENEAENPPSFYPFKDVGALKEIYVGAFSEVTKEQLEEWLQKYPHQVEFLKTRAAFQSFKICTNRLGFSRGGQAKLENA
ncbi:MULTISPECIES: DUF2971 domain-containing protein [unclassified Pseudovibrio]|uniref:DUF2971 domain-containing protein n=1 Tax=unclassified Pseudovibrio TaxID=2627060 RepID=UPI0007AEBA1B|nr:MULTISPECIES: DUF2971 domain-containing protein [unclassified Pseudovibrio]KZK96969.1 hypothetical protein PsW74_03842 [Pseudovibrio sp. W74]KZL08688.1 hypothetical protein PsAD14_02631 [Pseudovibrio sp. Ad14]